MAERAVHGFERILGPRQIALEVIHHLRRLAAGHRMALQLEKP